MTAKTTAKPNCWALLDLHREPRKSKNKRTQLPRRIGGEYYIPLHVDDDDVIDRLEQHYNAQNNNQNRDLELYKAEDEIRNTLINYYGTRSSIINPDHERFYLRNERRDNIAQTSILPYAEGLKHYDDEY